ncbi:hypothetical protein WMF20_03625 [Sorangium sp. So ce834]|uniref:hypothetical protein n=1 Tax=Sorangium sp. So ce834 TaxID=3133321 RepID=UPI003F61C744
MRSFETAVLPPRWLAAVAVLAGVLTGADARAEVQPLRVAYEAHEGCPSAEAFLREVTARTELARDAAPDEAALEVRVHITSAEGESRGRITVGTEEDARVREVGGATCADVVAALALITALWVDPTASLDPQRPTAKPRSSEDPDPAGAAGAAAGPTGAAPPAGALVPPGGQAPEPASPPRAGPPQAASLAPTAPVARPATAPPRPPSPAAGALRSPQRPLPLERRWTLGIQASAASGVAPEALLGGGPFVELRADLGLRASFRVAAEVAATGAIDVGPGGARFTRWIGRLDTCADVLRPARWLSLGSCVGAEGGFLHSSGLVGDTITEVKDATVPWASLGLLARMTASLGALVRVDVHGGPQFPLVQRSFMFERPALVIHEVPAVTWALHVGAGLSF